MLVRNKELINKTFENKPDFNRVDIAKFYGYSDEFKLFAGALAKNTSITYLKIPFMHGSMSNYDILPNLAQALKHNTSIQVLELRGAIFARDAKLIAEILRDNKTIKQLTIQNIHEGIEIIAPALKQSSITHLNCELSAFNDKQAELLLDLVKSNPAIVELKLSPTCHREDWSGLLGTSENFSISKKILNKISAALEANKKRLPKNNKASFFQAKEVKAENTIEKDLKDLISKLKKNFYEKNKIDEYPKIAALEYLNYQLEKRPGEYMEAIKQTSGLFSAVFNNLTKDDPVMQLINRAKNLELSNARLNR